MKVSILIVFCLILSFSTWAYAEIEIREVEKGGKKTIEVLPDKSQVTF